MPDWIPQEDDAFDALANQFVAPIALAPTNFGLVAADATALSAALYQWTTKRAAKLTADTVAQTATVAQNAAKAALIAILRADGARIQARPETTDEQRTTLGLPVRKEDRTPVPIPSTTPVMIKIDTSTRAILRLTYADSATPDKKAKPAGVQFCEIRQQVGGTAPTDPEAMEHLANEGRTPYRSDYEPAEVGQRVYFALRWLNTRGEPGPWSEIYNAVVPS